MRRFVATTLAFAFYLAVLLGGASAADSNAQESKRKASKARAEGDALLVSGDAVGALSKYAEAIALEPTEVKNYLKSFKANERLKRTQASLKDLTLAIENDEEKKELKNSLLLRGNIYASLGRCTDALKDYEQILANHPDLPDIRENRERAAKCVELIARADKLIEVGDWDGADNLLTEAIDVGRGAAPELKKKRARARYARGAHYECIADAGDVVKLDRNDVDILTLRGQAYYQLGDLDMALRHAQEALQSDPDFAEARQLHKMVTGIKRLSSAARKFMEQKEWHAAVGKFDQILETWTVPNEIAKTYLLDVCKCAGELKDRPWVHRACQRSFELDNNWIDSRIVYAEVLAATSESPEEWEETVRAWNQALQMDRENPKIHDGVRRAEAALKQSKTKNYYKILGVVRHADLAAVKKAYRDLAKLFHPDRHQGLSEEEMKTMQKKFADVAEAYEVLSDPEKRGKYDRGEDVFENQGGHHHNPHEQFFRRGGGGGGGGFQWSFNFG